MIVSHLRHTRRSFALLAAVVLLGLPSSVQAQQACTEMWCQEGTTIQLESHEWPQGEYRFAIEADGRQTICTSRLPFADCEGNTTCTGEGVTIGESGCAMGPEAHSFHGVMLQNIPAHLMLRIDHESGKTFAYETDVDGSCGYPNGRQCDPKACCSASLAADVEWK